MNFNELCPCCDENKKAELQKEMELIRNLKVWVKDTDVECLIKILINYVNNDLLS